ncbi:MAG: glycosyl hydrolase family 88 [Clostridiales bacterium]|nr:glycosyl hydrolase family 88 [Clostridiales bacterium]
MQDKIWAQNLLDEIYKKELEAAGRNMGVIPYTTVNGRFDDWTDRIWWWTNGFWGGLLWNLYKLYEMNDGDESILRRNAEIIEGKLEKNLMDYQGMDHDNGFKFLLTSVVNYKLTGNVTSKNRALLAAANLAGRFNLNAGLIRAWNDASTGETAGWAIIDCMMNLPLLYWASEEIKDPRFKQIAMKHADTSMKVFIRENGSSNHIVSFHPESGEFIESLGGQGLGVGSAWTRGQAWALYGFTLSYDYTKEQRYLDTAMKAADFFLSQIPEGGHIPVDFAQPKGCGTEDSSAAAIAACGLIELSRAVLEEKARNLYYEAATGLLKAIAQDRLNLTAATDNLLEKCTVAYHSKEQEMAVIYGDYYFVEALSKLLRS